MPKITGPKAFVISAPVVRDDPDIPDNTSLFTTKSQEATKVTSSSEQMINFTKPKIFPETEMTADDLTDDEL